MNLQTQLKDATDYWLNKAKPLLRSAAKLDPKIEVRYDLRGQGAGQLRRYRDGQLVIRYNLAMAELQSDLFIQQTVPHEVAHAITWLCHGKKARAHGKEWQTVMQFFGFNDAPRCHDFNLPIMASRQQRRWSYQCDCQQHELSTTRHNRVLRGLEYRCNKCHAVLS